MSEWITVDPNWGIIDLSNDTRTRYISQFEITPYITSIGGAGNNSQGRAAWVAPGKFASA